MRKLPLLLLAAVVLWAAANASAQPARTLAFHTGCNNVTLTFASGASAADVAGSVTPAAALTAIWRLDAGAGHFQGFSSAAPQASDLLTVEFLDAVFVCVSQQAFISMPAVPAPPSHQPAPMPTPTPSLRRGFGHIPFCIEIGEVDVCF